MFKVEFFALAPKYALQVAAFLPHKEILSGTFRKTSFSLLVEFPMLRKKMVAPALRLLPFFVYKHELEGYMPARYQCDQQLQSIRTDIPLT